MDFNFSSNILDIFNSGKEVLGIRIVPTHAGRQGGASGGVPSGGVSSLNVSIIKAGLLQEQKPLDYVYRTRYETGVIIYCRLAA